MFEEVTIGECRLILGDCREVLPLLPPVDLVLTDPPYGIGADKAQAHSKVRDNDKWDISGWDAETPDAETIALIVAAGAVAIIWGGNYFAHMLPPTMRWLVWDKLNEGMSLADCELAWTSQQNAARVFKYSRGNFNAETREHPTQKPLKLMEWCISHARKVATVCDPFMGSGTTGVACARMGLQFVGIERERKYFDIACRRIEQAYAQPRLFEDAKVGAGDTAVQGDMLLPANARVQPPTEAQP